jgi:hypothetical protein
MMMDDGTNREALEEGNRCIAVGLGIGGLGAGTLLAFGAACPLCLVAAPGLVGLGLLKRMRAKSPRGPAKASGELENNGGKIHETH